MPDEDIRDFESKFNPFQISELEIKYPYIQWLDYFNALMPNDMPITPDEIVIVFKPAYFDHLAVILPKTSKRTIANYFAWQYVKLYIVFSFIMGGGHRFSSRVRGVRLPPPEKLFLKLPIYCEIIFQFVEVLRNGRNRNHFTKFPYLIFFKFRNYSYLRSETRWEPMWIGVALKAEP